MATHESSVLVNLKDLFEMEAGRRADEAVAAERARAEGEARREREQRAREVEIAEARAEERRRADEERLRRDAALEERLRALRDELAEVQVQREAMQRKVSTLETRPSAPARRGVWMAGVMAAASMVAAVTATWVAWPDSSEPLGQLSSPSAEERAVEEEVLSPTPVEVAIVEPPPVVEEAAPAPSPVVASPARPTRREERRQTPRADPRVQGLDRQLDALGGGDRRDVLSPELLRP